MILLIPLMVVGFVCLVGAAAKEARKPLKKRGIFVNGTAALAKGGRSVWRRPGLVLDRVAVSYLVASVVLVAAVCVARPAATLKVAAVVVVALCVGWVRWDHRLTQGRPWRDVLADLRRTEDVRRAVADTHPDAKVGAVKVRGGRVEASVEHVGPVDHERVGQALHAPHTTLEPTAQMGRSKIVVHGSTPAPPVDQWAALSTVHRWPGPSSAGHDDPIPVGVDVHGRAVSIPCPGAGGKHLLIGGSTGSGKSVLLSVILAELAYRAHTRFMLGDPKHVELALFEPRAAEIAKGVAATGKLLDAVYAEMMARYKWLEEQRRRQFVAGQDGDRIMLVIDELAAVTTGDGKAKRLDALTQIIAMGRAAEVRLIGCTQRPSSQLLPTDIRDNFRSRIGLGCESVDQTEMVMGTRQWPCHEIPPSLQGAAFVKVDREGVLCRSYLLTDDDVDRVAATTSHLKGA